MLASLRSDRWTTSPEQVDGLTGIRTQFRRVESWRARLRVRWFLHTFRVVLSPAPIATFPAPASSNPACGFPALGCPVGFFIKGYVTYQAGSAFGL